MILRPFWENRVRMAWKEAPIVWLSGVRRSGKTTLALNLNKPEQVLYVNCDLPVTQERLRDPELFFRSCEKPIVIFDEVHQLKDPSRTLKIGADAFPHLRILATGSSSLAASKKFRDTLTGRKRPVHLLPALWTELKAFSCLDISRRLLQGGLPPALLSDSKNPSLYREWLDSFFARDMQKLFSIRNMEKFNDFFEYVLRQSGGQFEISKAAAALGISRITVDYYLQAAEIAHALTRVRPFHGGGQKEIIKMPKVYGFDTGFVTFVRGWDTLRPEDHGILWEHLVLEYLLAQSPSKTIRYWRDKAGHEVDFVLSRGRDQVDAIECKWNHEDFDPVALRKFRSFYPKGDNYLVCPLGGDSFLKQFGTTTVKICDPTKIPCIYGQTSRP